VSRSPAALRCPARLKYVQRTMRLWRLVLSFAMLLVSATSLAAAPKDPPGYTEAVNLGLAEFEAQNFVEARAHFARAHALSPSARTLRALGMVAFELKHYLECVDYLTQALASTERALDGEKRAQAERLRERANGYVGRYQLDLQPHTQVSVNGSLTVLGPGGQLALEAGDHVLEFRATGHVASRRTLTVQGGEHETLRVELAVLTVAVPDKDTRPDVPPPAGEKPTRRPVYKNPWLWTAVGLVLAGAAAGIAIVVIRSDTTTKTEEPYTGTGGAPALGTPR
jgi:hypothetical protein